MAAEPTCILSRKYLQVCLFRSLTSIQLHLARPNSCSFGGFGSGAYSSEADQAVIFFTGMQNSPARATIAITFRSVQYQPAQLSGPSGFRHGFLDLTSARALLVGSGP